MSPSTHPVFTGCAAALVTPFLPDGSIDENALKRLLAMQLEADADAVVLLGTTGEPTTLTMNEREKVIRTGVAMVSGRIPVIVGTGSNDTKKAVSYARQAEALGADAQLCVTPYYNKATHTGLIQHYNTIMDNSSLPLIAYNVPGRTGMTVTTSTVMQLAVHPHFAGIKEASGNVVLAAEIIEKSCGTIPVYSGCDELTVPMMAIGAYGSISVCANILPKDTRSMIQACRVGRFDEARTIQLQLTPLIRALFAQVNPIPVKAALAAFGMIHEILRLPLTPLEEPYRDQLMQILNQYSLH